MSPSTRNVVAVLAATLWISFFEFARNQFLLIDFWLEHFQSIPMTFPTEPINGLMWGVWSLLLALFIHRLLTKFSLFETSVIAWVAGFLMMWIVTANLHVLPYSILPFAIPLSAVEVSIAAWIIRAINPVPEYE